VNGYFFAQICTLLYLIVISSAGVGYAPRIHSLPKAAFFRLEQTASSGFMVRNLQKLNERLQD